MIEFKNDNHYDRYCEVRELMGGSSRDPYRAAVAYLIALDPVVYAGRTDVFDFEDGSVKHDGINKAWQTSTSSRTTRLAFNLWNGWCYDNDDDWTDNKPDMRYAVDNIFCGEYAEYYWQAIKIRFELDTICPFKADSEDKS